MKNLLLSQQDQYIISEMKIYYDKHSGYFRIKTDSGKTTYLHRFIMNAKKGEIVDHKNRVRSDNRRENLRIVSSKINAYNKEVSNPNGRGIYFDKYGIWASMIARCTGPDRYFGVIDLMLSTQRTWARAGDDMSIIGELSKIGRLAGLPDEQLQSCLQDADKLRALVAWYQENATRDGIRSTPTFLIDGDVHKNMNYDDFAAILDEKLGEK